MLHKLKDVHSGVYFYNARAPVKFDEDVDDDLNLDGHMIYKTNRDVY